MRKKFEMSLEEIEVDGCGGYYRAQCINLDTGVIVFVGDVYDNLEEALANFAVSQRVLYDKLNCCSTVDEWHVIVDLTLGLPY